MRRLAPAIVAVVPVVAMLLQQLPHLADHGLPQADWAVVELATRDAAALDRLTGPYSRWGFNHPGPAMFYWLAPFYEIGGETFSALVIGTLVFNILCFGAVVVVVEQALGRRAAWVAAAVVAIFTWRFGIERFRDPWNPYWVVGPLALLMVCALAAWARPRRWPLAVAVAAASVATQSHLGAAAVAVTMLLVAAAGTAVRWRDEDSTTGPQAWVRVAWPALATGAVLWLLPVVQQITGDPGNGTELYSFVRSDESRHAVSEVGPIVANGLAWRPTWLGEAYGPASPYVAPLQAHSGEYLFVGLTGIGLAAAALWAWRQVPSATTTRPVGDDSTRMVWVLLGVVPIVAALVETVASLAIRDELVAYLFMPVLAVALVWWLAGALYVGRLVVRFVPEDWQRWLLPSAAGLAAVVALVGSGTQFDRGGEAAADAWERRETAAMAPIIDDLCDEGRPVWIDSADTWVLSVPLGVGLARCGVEVSYAQDMAYMVGEDHASTRPPQGARRVCVSPAGQLRCDT